MKITRLLTYFTIVSTLTSMAMTSAHATDFNQGQLRVSAGVSFTRMVEQLSSNSYQFISGPSFSVNYDVPFNENSRWGLSLTGTLHYLNGDISVPVYSYRSYYSKSEYYNLTVTDLLLAPGVSYTFINDGNLRLSYALYLGYSSETQLYTNSSSDSIEFNDAGFGVGSKLRLEYKRVGIETGVIGKSNGATGSLNLSYKF